MTEAEAIAILQEQFTSERGFVARLRGGGGLDQEGAHLARMALDTVSAVWAEQACIPKAVARPMVDVLTQLQESAHLFPDMGSEIWRLMSDFSRRLNRVFATEPPRMTEETAAALVYGHLTGFCGVALKLHHHERLDDEWVGELQSALDVLADAWATRDCVPKDIVGPMLEAGELIRGHAPAYPNQQAELEAIADDLAERVKRCLS